MRTRGIDVTRTINHALRMAALFAFFVLLFARRGCAQDSLAVSTWSMDKRIASTAGKLIFKRIDASNGTVAYQVFAIGQQMANHYEQTYIRFGTECVRIDAVPKAGRTIREPHPVPCEVHEAVQNVYNRVIAELERRMNRKKI